MRLINGAILAICMAMSCSLAAQSNVSPASIEEMVSTIESSPDSMLNGHRVLTRDILLPFYANRGYTPAWSESLQKQAMELFRDADTHGLQPTDFLYYSLRDRTPPGAARDLMFTEGFIRYVYQRKFGKVNPDTLDKNINFKRKLSSSDPAVLLQQWLDQGGIVDRIDNETTHGTWYAQLREELRQKMALNDRGGWKQVKAGPTLHPGDRSQTVGELRTRLSLPQSSDPDLFSADLKQAVLDFQRTHGLDADGVVGPATFRAMNVPLQVRMDQLRASMERLRWVNREREDVNNFLAVNIAGYRVYVVKDGELRWSGRAMVGKTYRQTPVFGGMMQYLEFNPTWTVPPGIHRNDVLPAIKRDVNYLNDKHFMVLTPQGKEVDPESVDWQSYRTAAPYIFRQKPGPWNALGQVKFIFPNEHFVFLHDTNHRELFVQPSRAFSSGCIRVENPLELAEILLADENGWGRQDIDNLLASGVTKRAILSDRLPVYIVYLTAVPGLEGGVMYLQDIYERDSRLLAKLDLPMQWEMPGSQ